MVATFLYALKHLKEKSPLVTTKKTILARFSIDFHCNTDVVIKRVINNGGCHNNANERFQLSDDVFTIVPFCVTRHYTTQVGKNMCVKAV